MVRNPSVLPALPPRRSSAALRSAAQSETTRTILTALAVNLLVAAAKLVAGLLSGSAALLAEAGHSLADSLNEVLLGISVRRGGVPADVVHPLGHGRERFLWAFMAAMASFLIGGCVSIGLAIRELVEGGSTGSLLPAWVVLVVGYFDILINFGLGILIARQVARDSASATRYMGAALQARAVLWGLSIVMALAIAGPLAGPAGAGPVADAAAGGRVPDDAGVLAEVDQTVSRRFGEACERSHASPKRR